MQHTSALRRFMLLSACIGAINTAWGDNIGGDMSAGQEASTQKNIQVTISGTDETRYAATWTVTESNGEQQQFEESGSVPANFAYSGEAIAGTVTQLSESGRLEVEIRKNGNRSRSATQGKGSVVRVRVQ